MYSHIAYLILGTNLGNRNKNLSNARLEINGLPQTRILKKSKILYAKHIIRYYIYSKTKDETLL